MSVLDNLCLYYSFRKEKINKDKIIETLEYVGLKADILNDKIKYLFGGEKQRLSIARALLANNKVILADDVSCRELDIQQVRFHKNFAIVKFAQINDINELIKYKGQRIFISKSQALNSLEKNEYLISDLTGCIVYKEDGEKIGEVVSISSNSSHD